MRKCFRHSMIFFWVKKNRFLLEKKRQISERGGMGERKMHALCDSFYYHLPDQHHKARGKSIQKTLCGRRSNIII